MAYDRYDRDNDRSRWSGEDRNFGRERDYERDRSAYGARDRGSGDQDRGFFERMGEEVRSWFGDEDSDRSRHDRPDHGRGRFSEGRRESGWRDRDERGGPMMGRSSREQSRGGMFGGSGGERDWDRERSRGSERNREYNENRGPFARGGSSERDYNPGWRGALWGGGDRDRDHDRDQDSRGAYRGYRPMTGDYGRSSHESDQLFAASGYGRGERGAGEYRSDYSRSDSQWDRDDYRSTSRAGTSDKSDRSRETGFDPHYRSWRERHMSDLDRDYEDYRREHQSKFESDFGGWREKRQQKRGMLGQIREHMEVVGNDDEHVGTVDKVVGDRIILTKSDPASGGTHHSLSCAEVDRVEGDRIILECTAVEARVRWLDEDRSRALFEREDQGEMGPRILDRSFEGTYR